MISFFDLFLEAEDARKAVQTKIVFSTMSTNKTEQQQQQIGAKMTKFIEFKDLPSHAASGPGVLPNDRKVPVFGGRMTEKRLKEVGRMTKEAIEHLHKYISFSFYAILNLIVRNIFF